MSKVFLTGATGFIGSHILNHLILQGYEVMALKRLSSHITEEWKNNKAITWIDSNSEWEPLAIQWNPSVIIHAAWIGVLASERDDSEIQTKNNLFIERLLEVAQQSNCKKIIALGSQAEYGDIDSIVDETYPLNPTTAYGKCKVKAIEQIQTFCETNSIEWFWLRIFSLMGYNQSTEWLIPSIVNEILTSAKREKDFTAGEQVYSYLDVTDFIHAVDLVLSKGSYHSSGIYNVTANNSLSIKELITKVRNLADPSFHLNFGAIPYRPNQPMFVVGSSKKFISSFGNFQKMTLEESIEQIINYQKTKNETF